MTLPTHFSDLLEIEALLGNPFDESHPLSYKNTVAADELDQLPDAALEYITQHGIMEYLIPRALGGKLHSYQHLYYVIRSLARRDVTLATIFVLRAIGFAPVLVQGTPEQKRECADDILNDQGISWGITEREHGSDLMNNGATADQHGDMYRLNGSKWLIGCASLAPATMFLARTSDSRGADSLTMFRVDRRKQTSQSFISLPREKLHGVRGLNLSGYELKDCIVEENNIIGEKGCGLELMLRAAQLHRVGVVTLALGALDTGMRIAMSFAHSRELFDKKLSEIPITRHEFVDTYCEMMLSEIVVSSATRALHFDPKSMFLLAAVAKFLVPAYSNAGFKRLANIIGARYFLRENFAYGVFQKAMRDIDMLSFVDGNEKVNLKNISLHMEVTLPYLEKGKVPSDAERENFSQLYDFNQLEPDARFSDLVVFSGKKDNSFIFLGDSIERLKVKLDAKNIDGGLKEGILHFSEMIQSGVLELYGDLKAQKEALKGEFNYSPQSYDLAQRYALLHSGADCIHTVVYTDFAEPMDTLVWLPLCLRNIVKQLDSTTDYADANWVQETFKLIERQYNRGAMFSLMPLQHTEKPDAFCHPKHMNI